MSARVAIAFGSNVGDRAATITRAALAVGEVVSHLRLSGVVETEPVGVEPQPLFLNAVAVGRTRCSPRALLDALLAIEARFGRVRPYAGAPRTLDLDLILFDDHIIDEPGLVVPHPRFRDRRFVLQPLADVAPEWRDPVTGQSVAELLRRLP